MGFSLMKVLSLSFSICNDEMTSQFVMNQKIFIFIEGFIQLKIKNKEKLSSQISQPSKSLL